MTLSVKNLGVSYGRIMAVKDLSFSISPGESLALLGPNGAGKTSAVEAIAGLIPKAGGSVSFDGSNITELSADKIVRRGIALVPQWRELFPAFSVNETLLAAVGASEDRSSVTIDTIYDYFPALADRKNQAAGSLSGGEQQMLAIGRALVTNPRIILLDEPSAGLSMGIGRSLVGILSRIRETGVGLLVVEQNLELARSLATSCVVLAAATTRWQGEIDDALHSDELRRAYFE
jgi:branched-chain amino acid transport system ATP-binding protein